MKDQQPLNRMLDFLHNKRANALDKQTEKGGGAPAAPSLTPPPLVAAAVQKSELAAPPAKSTPPSPISTGGAPMLNPKLAEPPAPLPPSLDTPPTEDPKAPKPPSRLWTEYYGAIFLLLTGAFLTAGFLFLRPLILEYRGIGGTITATSEQLRDENEYLESLQRSIEAARSIPEQTLDDVNEALPRDMSIPKLLQILAEIAQQNGVQLNSVQFSEPRLGDSSTGLFSAVQAMDINLGLQSSGYAYTRRFLDTLEHSLRLFDVQTITVAATNGSERR